MKKLIILLLVVFVLDMEAQIVFHDAGKFPLLGKASTETETRYERLPASLKGIVRDPVWSLGKNAAGLAIRFSSNSTTISARWTVLNDNSMNHMAPTGIKGLDLYTLENGKWMFVNCGRPGDAGKSKEAVIVSNMLKKDREFMLFLPLYDGVTSLSIGVDSLADISLPKTDLPVRNQPVVCYGTSILQGGCASRPGMAHTNILMNRLNREFINLGFSGNGRLDYEIAEVMANIKHVALFILDFVPNASVEEIRDKTERFYSIIRNKHPDTPILFVENPIYTHTKFDKKVNEGVTEKNKMINEVYTVLRKKDKNIQLLSSKNMIGDDGEATVDGVHFTDLGFIRYADLLTSEIKKMID